MKMNNNDDKILDQYNAEYVVLQTANMNISNKSSSGKLDSLGLLLEESESVTNFRRFLDSINCGHFLDFWFACQGFKNFDKSDSHKINQLMKVIYKAYIKSESPFAVPLKSNTKKSIVDKLNVRKIFDPAIFDSAQLEIRDILAGEFLIKFYKSEFYTDSNLLDKDSLSSFNNNPQSKDVPVSSCSSTGYISRRSMGLKNLVASRSYDAVSDGCGNRTHSDTSTAQITVNQGPDTVTSGLNDTRGGNNTNSTGSKDRRNLSEIDPVSFAKVLSSKLEEVFAEQTNFERMLRYVKSAPNESDTDDSHNSAINYLLKCQWYTTQTGQCCSVDGDLGGDCGPNGAGGGGMKTTSYCPGDGCSDDYAQDILESHCSRIGLAKSTNDSRHPRRDSAEVRGKWRKDIDLGSTTSYDSGVATSLEPQSSLCLPPQLLETICQLQRDGTKTSGHIDPRYHHHHHHHHHRNHGDSPFHKDFLKVNNVSDVSSNLDSGISSTYENLGRRFQAHDDKVTNWMIKNPKVTSKPSYKFNDSSYPDQLTSGITPNTPLISSRGVPSLCSHDPYSSHQRFSPLPGSGIRSCQKIETWLDQQDTLHPLARSTDNRSRNYCSSTVGVAGSELLSREETCPRDQRSCQSSNQSAAPKDQQKQKPPGPLVVGYYMGNDPVPYRTQISDTQNITLGQFKSLIAKKGPFRYFFKRYCDEFECGVVHEEITKDDAILPLWEGKIVAKIEKSD